MKVMLKFYFVKKFMRYLRENTIYRRPKHLKTHHYDMINDWVLYDNNKDENSIFAFFSENRFFRLCGQIFAKLISGPLKEKLKHFFGKKIGVIHPTKTFRLIWDLIQIILTIIYSVIVPIRIGFEMDLMDGFIPNSLQFFATFLLVLDIAIKKES